MVLFNYSTKELTAKVVYYGPGLCGKTTNLQWIHEKLPIKNKGKMLSLATETDRTLFFDFLPIEIGTIRGMKTRIQLYTVPGQVFYNATRRMVLKGADAVVFVCDSQEPTFEGNIESFENLRQNLIANEIDPDETPVVLQYNKRDLSNALPIEILNERLNKRGYPWFEAVAVKGIGVEETLKAVTKLVFRSLSARYGDAAAPTNRGGSRPAPAVSGAVSVPPVSAAALPPLATPPTSASAPPRPPAPVEPKHVSPPPREAEPAPDDSDDPGNPFGSLPPLELELADDELEPGPSLAHVSPAPVPLAKPDLPTRPPVPPTPPPPPRSTRPAERTLITNRDEADELRRRISTPGLADEDEDLELEELEEELEHVPRLPLGSAPPLPLAARPRALPQTPPVPETPLRTPPPMPTPTPPRPLPEFESPVPSFGGSMPAFDEDAEPAFDDQPEPGRRRPASLAPPATPPPAPAPFQSTGHVEVEESFEIDGSETEVEVPIDVEIAPGTTRLTLRLRLNLSFKQ